MSENNSESYVESRKYTHLEAVAEALLFAAGQPVSLDDLALVLKLSRREAELCLEKLSQRYAQRGGGILLRRMENAYQFCSRPDFREDLRSYFEKPVKQGLSRAALETLSVIAYNQPVTRAGIELVRGVNSDGVLSRLIENGLVAECGRSDAPGRPLLYGTTEHFLRSMGIASLQELPPLERVKTESAEEETEESAKQPILEEEREAEAETLATPSVAERV